MYSFLSLFLFSTGRAAGAGSYFMGTVSRLAAAHTWLAAGTPAGPQIPPSQSTASQPSLNQHSALLACSIWHNPSSGPGTEPRAWGEFLHGKEGARETALPRLCSLGQDPQIWLPSASSNIWPNVLSSFCLFCSNSFLANTILRVVLILIDEAGTQSCLGMVRHYLSRKINSHVHSSSFQKTGKKYRCLTDGNEQNQQWKNILELLGKI